MLKSMTLDRLVRNFEVLGNWEERYRYIIQMGKKLPVMPEEDKTEDNRVTGCISRVWLTHQIAENEAGATTLTFVADSDAHIVKGLIAFLLMLFSGRTPAEILAVNIEDVFTRLGLDRHLSPNRRNGFVSMLEKIRKLAVETAAA